MSAPRVEQQVDAIRKALDGRALVWFGIRGEDAESLLQVPEFHGSYAITAAARSASLHPDDNVTLEERTNLRVDLDTYDLDLDTSAEADEFRAQIIDAVSRPCVLMTYRPSVFVSDLAFSMSHTMLLAGMYADRQRAFEHKPWIETSLERLGVSGPGWTYVSSHHLGRAHRRLASGPAVVRSSRDSGGVGISLVNTPDELEVAVAASREPFVAVAPYFANGIPVNVGGCVFRDGTVRLHAPSVQLIGLESCTTRRFGYCGNDFAAIRNLPTERIRDFDDLCRTVGQWLHRERYLGAFGIDALITEENVLFTEVNPRFQGSSSLGAELAADIGEADLYLDHLAAFVGVQVDEGLPLTEWVDRQPERSHVVVHNTWSEAVSSREDEPLRRSHPNVAEALVSRVAVSPGGVLGRLLLDHQITTTGFDVSDVTSQQIARRANQASVEHQPASWGH